MNPEKGPASPTPTDGQVVSEADRFAGCLMGLAVGDALGTTVEFIPRGSFAPVTDMVGGGPFNLPAGAWTDDTSMALCLGESLLACSKFGGFDAADQMRRYVRWWTDGHWGSTGICVDIGTTVREALVKFRETGNPHSGPVHDRSAGNGSIMRLAPVAMYYYPDYEAVVERCGVSSWTTHGATACVEACRLLGAVLFKALNGCGKDEVLGVGRDGVGMEFLDEGIGGIARGDYLGKGEEEIRGSGYVVESLEAALWCFARTESYEKAVLMAVNLGNDADTTAAICGQVAGAYYGMSGIPQTWNSRIVRGRQIKLMAEKLRD
jgi:ADP-ribosyl-[dinitrogen reductase] hydrolase